MISMKAIVLKSTAIWLVLVICQLVGGMLLFRGAHGAPAFAADGPLNAGQALLTVNLVEAVLLAALASAMRLRGVKLGLTLATVYFGGYSGLSAIEVVIYHADLPVSLADLNVYVMLDLFRSVAVGAAIAFIWRGEARGDALNLRGLVWKLPAVAAVYVVCYSAAGYGIAWQSAAVHAYYVHIAEHYSFAMMMPLQFGRGLIWSGLAWLLARGFVSATWPAALLTGFAFSLLMAAPLLYPAPFMPWSVRVVHLVEIGSSNLVFGIIAALILLGGATRSAPSATASAAAAVAI